MQLYYWQKLKELKVSKSRMQIFKVLLEPKKEHQIFLYFCPSFKKTPKMWSKQKVKAQKDYFNAIYYSKVKTVRKRMSL